MICGRSRRSLPRKKIFRQRESRPILHPSIGFATAFSDSGENLNGLVSDLSDQASSLKELLTVRTEIAEKKSALEKQGAHAEAAKIVLPEVDRAGALAKLREGTSTFENIATALSAKIGELLASPPRFSDPATQKLFRKWQRNAQVYRANLPRALEKLRAWSPDRPVPWYRSISSFLFGREWITASFWQDWYGIIPLAGRIDSGCDCRARYCGADRRRLRHLRERSRFA